MTYTLHRKHLLRYLSRRKPCIYLLLVQLGILALLIGFFILTMLFLNKSKKRLAVVKAESRIYQNYVGSITLSHCQYMYPEKYDELCDRQCGSSAFIVLRYENSFGRKMESTCPSLIETIPCHEKPAQCNHRIQIRQCPGVNGIHLPRNLSITSLSIVKMPVLNISTVKGKIISALEIFAVCPRCRIYSHSYKQLETVREGWPEQYRICDGEVNIIIFGEDLKCNSVRTFYFQAYKSEHNPFSICQYHRESASSSYEMTPLGIAVRLYRCTLSLLEQRLTKKMSRADATIHLQLDLLPLEANGQTVLLR
ncbi:Type II restriction enzyme TthHB8I [Dirofilaria immitis]